MPISVLHVPMLFAFAVVSPTLIIQTSETTRIELPKPVTEGGLPLMAALKQRQSIREIDSRELPLQTLSDLLWAAWGINRPDGRRTAPSAMNKQEIDVYVVLKEGTYLFNALEHSLARVTDKDLRPLAGTQEYAQQAPVNLVYVADQSKMQEDRSETVLYYGVSSGSITQNVYLFCASAGLATTVRASIDRPALAEALKLRPAQVITLGQSVGFPK